MKTYEEIRALYIKRYPHLDALKNPSDFAKAALILAAPDGVSIKDVWALSKEI